MLFYNQYFQRVLKDVGKSRVSLYDDEKLCMVLKFLNRNAGGV